MDQAVTDMEVQLTDQDMDWSANLSGEDKCNTEELTGKINEGFNQILSILKKSGK